MQFSTTDILNIITEHNIDFRIIINHNVLVEIRVDRQLDALRLQSLLKKKLGCLTKIIQPKFALDPVYSLRLFWEEKENEQFDNQFKNDVEF